MTNYVSLLTDEQLISLCKIITARNFKELFRKNPQSFNRIKNGLNYKKASEDETFSFVVKNRDEEFICRAINSCVHQWLDEIQKITDKLISEGKKAEAALTETLSTSMFSDEIELYFLLSGENYSEEYVSMTKYAIELKAMLGQAEETAKEAKESVEQIENELSERTLETGEKIDSLQNERDELRLSKATLVEENTRLNTQLADYQAELQRYQKLAEYAVQEEIFSPATDYSFLSLCCTYTDERGQARLLRLADISVDGEICSGFLENTPSIAYLYQNKKDIERQDGFFGIWNWAVTPNKFDPTKDYYIALYNPQYIPIETVLIDNCYSISELKEQLKSGISISTISERMMISFFNGAVYEGFLCDAASLDYSLGIASLKQSVVALAEFEYSENDVVHIENKTFLRFISTGIPKRVEKVKNSLEMAKEILLSRMSWSIFKQKEYRKNEYRLFKDLISELPIEEILIEISSKCDCSIEEARDLIDELTRKSEDVLFGKTFENEIMAQIIRNDETLLKECHAELRQEWEEQNQKLLDAAEQKLSESREEDSRLQMQLERKKKECTALDNRVEMLQEQIEKKQQLANDVEEQVNAKIDQARKNAAAFIAEYAFTRPLSDSSNVATSPVLTNSHYTEGTYRDIAELEQNDNWEKLLQTVQAELQEAGVSSDKVIGLSGILYAAYLSKVPLLLAGPNGLEIANAFSLALYGCTPGTLHCDGDFNESDLQQATNSNTEIVVIENMFEHSWYSGILRLLSQRRRFYMVVHPFGEDLAIEPNSLINYCFPLYTDSLVDSASTMNYVGGYMVEPFTEFVQEKINERKCYNKLLKEMKLSLYAKKAVQRMLTDYHALLPGNTTEEDYTFVLEPLACFLGLSDELEEYKKDHTTQPVGETQ